MFLIKLALLLVLTSSNLGFAEVARPSNLKVEGVEAGTPTECAAFFQQSGWAGDWDNLRPHELWVENIHKDCTAQVVYAYGARQGKNDIPSYFRITNAEIKGDTMSFSLPSNSAKITVTYKLSDDKLHGSWQSDKANSISTVTLTRTK